MLAFWWHNSIPEALMYSMGVCIRMCSVWASRLEWAGSARGCHCHHCCSLVGPGECVVLLIVVLGSVVSGSALQCGTFFTSKIMIN